MDISNIIGYIGFAGLVVLVFLVFREVLTWYWKTNLIVSLLKQIERNTRVSEAREEISSMDPVPKSQSTDSVWRDGKWGDK